MSELQSIRANWDVHAKALNRRYYNASGQSMTLHIALSSARKVKGRARRVANRIIQLDSTELGGTITGRWYGKAPNISEVSR